MVIVLGIFDAFLMILSWVIIAQVILSWLLAFNVLNSGSGGVRAFIMALERITGPLYRPLRRILPDFGGLDFSPLVVLLAIWITRDRIIAPVIDSYRIR